VLAALLSLLATSVTQAAWMRRSWKNHQQPRTVMEPTGILRYSDNIYSGSEEKTRKKAKNKN
jgi:hypothetical protein